MIVNVLSSSRKIDNIKSISRNLCKIPYSLINSYTLDEYSVLNNLNRLTCNNFLSCAGRAGSTSRRGTCRTLQKEGRTDDPHVSRKIEKQIFEQYTNIQWPHITFAVLAVWPKVLSRMKLKHFESYQIKKL